MRNPKTMFLVAIVLASALSLMSLQKPVGAATTVGVHQAKAFYYSANVANDHDSGLAGPGEWYFYLYTPNPSVAVSGPYSLTDGQTAGFSLIRVWQLSGRANLEFRTRARELDTLGWDANAESIFYFTIPFPSAIPNGAVFGERQGASNGVTHYIRYYVYNTPPVPGAISVEPVTSKDKSGENSVYKGFPTTFLAKGFIDNEGDTITYEWKVDGVSQTSKSSRMAYAFTTSGSHTVQARAKDALGAYSGWKTKIIQAVTYTFYYRFSYHQCTYYAALEFDKYGYDGIKAASPGIDWGGDAGNWFTNAKAQGWATTTSANAPRKGAIIVWKGGAAGHVAVVLSFNSTHIRIAEMNWATTSTKVEVRYLPISNLARGSYTFTGYIYPYKG